MFPSYRIQPVRHLDDFSDVQTQLKALFDKIKNNPLTDGKLIANQSLVTGNNIISHGLDRNYLSFLCSLPTTNVTLQEGVSSDRSKYLVITASGTCVVSIFAY